MVTYIITSDDIEDVDNAISSISQEDFVTELAFVDEVEVASISPPGEVLAKVDIVVDASNVDDVSYAFNNVIENIQSQDENYQANGQGIKIHFVSR